MYSIWHNSQYIYVVSGHKNVFYEILIKKFLWRVESVSKRIWGAHSHGFRLIPYDMICRAASVSGRQTAKWRQNPDFLAIWTNWTAPKGLFLRKMETNLQKVVSLNQSKGLWRLILASKLVQIIHFSWIYLHFASENKKKPAQIGSTWRKIADLYPMKRKKRHPEANLR